MKKQKSIFNVVFITVIGIVLAVYALSIVFTLGWGLLTSFKSVIDFDMDKNVLGLQNADYSEAEIAFENYKRIFRNFQFDRSAKFYINGKYTEHYTHATFFTMLINTILYAVVGSLLQAIVPAVCAYLCAKFKYKYSKIIYTVVLFSMIIPIYGSTSAALALLKNMGVYDTFIGYFMQKFNFTNMYFFVYFGFYESMPDTFSEAAEIDGASRFRILLSIIIPLSVKMISTVWLLQFVTFWNDYQTSLLYMPTYPTLAYGIYVLCHETAKGDLANVPSKVAGCMILALPLLMIFIVLKDKLMGNISLGGIKG